VRAALQDFNLKGGLRGKPLRHQVIEVDSSAASIKSAVQSIKADSQVVAMVGTVGSATASQVADLLLRDLPDIAHVAPWLQSSRAESGDNTFSIFASRQEQITFALKSLALMGVQEIGAVYATQSELSQYRSEVEQAAKNLKLNCKHIGPTADLQQLGRTLSSNSPRILVFLGGTPELAQFAQGIDKQASQRYVVAMSDVNLQTLQQLGMSRHAPVIATQVVPLANAGVLLVKNYRDTLARLFDEPPTPQSLAGFVAARYCIEVLHGTNGSLSRSNVLAAFQQRNAVELGGFKVDPDTKRRGAAYVTQSMIATDGRIVG
jgi:ABC-type branched-subunit amino acid transport system substrate-binding protein